MHCIILLLSDVKCFNHRLHALLLHSSYEALLDKTQLRSSVWLQISSKQLRDDLMTMLIAGHETTAAVLTWTFYCLTSHPDVVAKIQQEVSLFTNS